VEGHPLVDQAVARRILEQDHPADTAHAGDSLKVVLPALDRPERLGERVSESLAIAGPGFAAGLQVGEIQLVQDHAVVLIREATRAFSETEVLSRLVAIGAHLGKLLHQRVHLIDVSLVQIEVLGDLSVRDPGEPFEVSE
jgi:hypothetical protein